MNKKQWINKLKTDIKLSIDNLGQEEIFLGYKIDQKTQYESIINDLRHINHTINITDQEWDEMEKTEVEANGK